MISLRIPPDLERKLDLFAKSKGKSRSEIVKESILEYIKNHSSMKTPFELGEDLFAKYASNNKNLAKNRKAHLINILKEKNEKRRSH
ncbi:ribbon-helix-helix protein, CopG family [Leptospira inadai serovar Lyme str. 10]|uniref:Ribbon-helix-helix protein, CopG family n=2 Tax=Leptospira inadai serovar Lyme TaxID=293084 RepID=V6HAZ2_9LEPT|nr:ribbon-helix-helix protein, CopG family [Leptospira inadai]EQA36696.1 ribbon-helix-helix protein, CopG family [Leptospira inadai serovar Lyme str. 10]PNV75517.1 ribbon-helix-helix protein, CopG family [Leptospira inadai serovar Lyme]